MISKVTDAVMEPVAEWQSRPLGAVYLIIYLNCIVVNIRQDKKAINKAFYLVLGINIEGHKELLGLCPIGKTINVCSGKAYTLREVITLCEKISGYQIKIRVNPEFVRANDEL